MAYAVIWSPNAMGELKKLEPDLARRIVKKVSELELAPYHFVEKMANENCWKMRVGEYRVLLDIDEGKKRIDVLKVGHRKNVYK